MHELMLREIIKCCQRRISQGDCPIERSFTIEQLESAVVELASRIPSMLIDAGAGKTDEELRVEFAHICKDSSYPNSTSLAGDPTRPIE